MAAVHHSPLAAIWRRRRIVVLGALLGLAGGLLSYRFSTPMYTASSRIMATSGGPRAISAESNAVAPNNLYTQLSVINSAVIAFQATALLQDPQWYWDNGYEVMVGGKRMRNPKVQWEGYALPAGKSTAVPTGAEVVPLRALEGPSGIAQLRQNLHASVGKNDQIITISFDAPRAEEAPIVANAVAAAYLNFAAGEKHGSADEVVRALQQKRDDYKREINEKNQAIAAAVRLNSLMYIDNDKTNPLQRRLEALGDALTSANLSLLSAKQAYDDVARSSMRDPEKLRVLIETGTFDGKTIVPGTDDQRLLGDLRIANQVLADLRARYLDNHPAIHAVQAKLDELNAEYVLLLRRRYEAQQERINLLQRSFDEANKAVQDMGVEVTRYRSLIADRENTTKMLDAMDTRMKEIHVDDEASGLNLKLLEPAALPVAPTKPVLLVVLFEGLMLGLIAGVGGTFLDHRLRSVQEVTETTGLPVLAALPRMRRREGREGHGRKVQMEPAGEVAEAIRTLRGALLLGPARKTVLVTSAVRGEGKSTIAANLAMALAATRRRVLLIDADLRDPMQHQIFQFPGAAAGLSDVIAGEALVDDVIIPTAVARLDLLPAGRPGVSPAEVISGQAFLDLLHVLGEQYDCIVLDAPPAIPVVDARVLGEICDVTLLVLRADKTSHSAACGARDGLLSFGANLLGVVVNDVRRRQDRYAYYYGGYGYGSEHRSAVAAAAAAAAAAAGGRPLLGLPEARIRNGEDHSTAEAAKDVGGATAQTTSARA